MSRKEIECRLGRRIVDVELMEVDMSQVVNLQPGPVQHQDIPHELQRVVRWQFRHVGRFVVPTYEHWELGFLRDLFMEQEIATWTRLTWGVLEYVKRHPGSDPQSVLKRAFETGVVAGARPKWRFGREFRKLAMAVPEEYFDVTSSVYDQ
jgi:hypothetical protein